MKQTHLLEKLVEKGRHDVEILLPQQTERPQNRDARIFTAFEAVNKTVVDLQATEDDDDAVKDVEAVADVAEETVRLERFNFGSVFLRHFKL